MIPGTEDPSATNAQKQRTGLVRLRYAWGYSLAGLRAAWGETAFRQECWLAMVLVPASWYVGQNWVERSLLLASVGAVLVVELLNSAIEATVDRMGPEWHALAKRAKDMGSAAVLLTLLWCALTWLGALANRFF